MTAADVVFSLETLRDKGRPNFKNSYSKITRIETPDARTITFTQEAAPVDAGYTCNGTTVTANTCD